MSKKEFMVSTMYSIFEELMRTKGVKTSDIVKATGISASTLSDWKHGRIKNLKAEKLKLIAEFFGVSVEYLMTGHDTAMPQPVYAVSAGQGVINDGHPTETITEEEDMTLENGYCRVIGDSMYPILHDGDCIRIRQQTVTEPTDLTVLRIDGEAITIKYVEVTDTGIWVRAENKDVFEDRFYSIQEVLSLPVSIIGKAVAIVERKL